MSKRISPMGSDWQEFRKEIFTPEEIAACDLKVTLISEIIMARREMGVSQKQLEGMSGVKQPVIARMEKGSTKPQLDTILKLLSSLGKTLSVVPLKVQARHG